MGVCYHAHARFFDNHGNKVTVPAPWDDWNPSKMCWYDYIAEQAPGLKKAGFSAILLPPPSKTLSGRSNTGDGYGVYDQYDLGSRNQMYALPTHFGTREELQRAIAVCHQCGLDVYTDLVFHQVMGGNNGVYRYFGADGVTMNGAFPKDPGNFRGDPPRSPEDPVPVPYYDFAFGDEFVYDNCVPHRYTVNKMIEWADRLTRTLDVQGYRCDDVKGTWVGFINEMMNSGSMAGKFFVSEYFDDNPASLSWWSNLNNKRSSVFDFNLHFALQNLCDNNGSMRAMNGVGYTTWDAAHAVTFIDNPDTDLSFGENIIANKLLAYAFILTVEGYPFIYHKDYADGGGCYGLKKWIDNLIWIHENLANGPTVTQFVSNNVIVFNRTGSPGLLAAISNDPVTAHTITCPTAFGPNVELQDYTGRHHNIWTDGYGNATFTVPSNAFGSGQSVLCFSRTNYTRSFELQPRATHTTLFGDPTLDIGPAKAGQTVKIWPRLWCGKDTPLRIAPADGSRALHFGVLDPDGLPLPVDGAGETVIQKRGYHTITVSNPGLANVSFEVTISHHGTAGIHEADYAVFAAKMAAAHPEEMPEHKKAVAFNEARHQRRAKELAKIRQHVQGIRP